LRFAVSLLALRPGRIGGTENYVRSLLAALPAALDGHEVVVVAATDAARSIETPGLERVVIDAGDAAMVARRSAEAMTPWRDRRLEDAFAALRCDAVFFPQISIYPKAVAAPAVVNVGDVQHLVAPRNIRVAERVFRRAIYPRSLAAARIVTAVSERTRRDLVEHAGVDERRIRVIRHGCPPMRAPAGQGAGASVDHARASFEDDPPVRGPFLYYPAVTHPHKGHDELLEAFSYLVMARVPLRLVFTGQRTRYWKKLEARARRLGLGERVHHLGYVATEVVEWLYANAAAVVFPSRFEGFGLPVVEAASFGARVIVSDLDVFDEHGTEGVHRIDFRQPEQLRAALASTTRARIADGAWSWEDAARATVAALVEAAAASRTTPSL
jgi:glycosyltransferase involved in cell wall biosynthesis